MSILSAFEILFWIARFLGRLFLASNEDEATTSDKKVPTNGKKNPSVRPRKFTRPFPTPDP